MGGELGVLVPGAWEGLLVAAVVEVGQGLEVVVEEVPGVVGFWLQWTG